MAPSGNSNEMRPSANGYSPAANGIHHEQGVWIPERHGQEQKMSVPGLPRYGVPPWLLACSMLVCYFGFIPSVLLCSYNQYLFYIAAGFGFGAILLECVVLIERHGRKENLPVYALLLQDIIEVLKILCTTLVPMLMFTFGGASFAFVAMLHSHADGCSVNDLGRLGTEGYLSFNCKNGFTAPFLQEHIHAWSEPAGRRLRMTHHAMHHAPVKHGNMSGASYGLVTAEGYIAPVFQTRDLFLDGAAPVAWAVKAGSPVSTSQCDLYPQGSCGIFALTLRDLWRRFEAIPRFGAGWGFNITKLKVKTMQKAAKAVQAKHPRDNWGPEAGSLGAPFVIMEDFTAYLGSAIPLLWVSIALLVVGFIDRLAQMAAFKQLKPYQESSPREYNNMTMVHESALEVEEERGIVTEMWHMWNDPLNYAPGGSMATLAVMPGENPPYANGTSAGSGRYGLISNV